MARPNKQAMSAVSGYANDYYSITNGYNNYQEKVRDGVVQFGKNNDFPDKIARLKQDSPWHAKGIVGTSKFIRAKGLGLVPVSATDTTEDQDILNILEPANIIQDDWQEIDELISQDIYEYKGFYLQVIWAADGMSIADVYYEDFKKVRVGERDEFGRITKFYISKDWGRGWNPGKMQEAVEIAAFNPANRFEEPNQLFYCYFKNSESEVYPMPEWFGVIDNVIIDKLLNKHKVAFLNNGINISNVMQLVTDKSDKEFQKFVNKFDKNMASAANSGRTAYLKVPTGGQFHQITNPSVKNNAEAYNSYYEQNTNIILSGHNVVYRDLFGIESTMASLAAERVIEKSVLYQNTVIGDYQRKKIMGLNKLAPFLFPGMKFAVKPMPLFEGLSKELEHLGLNVDSTPINRQ